VAAAATGDGPCLQGRQPCDQHLSVLLKLAVCATATGSARGPPALRAASLGTEGEAPEQVKERRLRESQRVEERVHVVFSYDEFRQELQQARPRCPQDTQAFLARERRSLLCLSRRLERSCVPCMEALQAEKNIAGCVQATEIREVLVVSKLDRCKRRPS